VSRAVLITRHPAECGRLQSLLDPAGITVRSYPVLRLVDVDDRPGWRAVRTLIGDAPARPWLAVASPRAPQRLVMAATRHDADALLGWPVAAVGETTADAAREAGLTVEVVGPGDGAGLADALIPLLNSSSAVVLACGKDRRPELPAALEAAGHPVIPAVVYAMEATPVRELPPLGPDLEAVIVTSPRAARHYLEAVGGHPLPLPHWALGPTTQHASAAMGIQCRIPEKPTLSSLAEELCRI
jgi:uroporphyrinogen-III synthase